MYDINGNVLNIWADEPTRDFITDNDSGLQQGMSSFTAIDGVLYVFCAYAVNDHTTTTGYKYKINGDGTLTRLQQTFTCNFGHQNTVDFNPNNRCLLSTNGGNSTCTLPSQIYIMGPYAVGSNPTSFLIADGLTIDISQEGWGKQPNAVWADSNIGANDMIYVFTNYEEGNMTYYDQANVDNFTGESKRFIHKLQLGKGSNNLGSGTMRTVAANAFNGTYKVIGSWEFPFVFEEAINDMCTYRGKIYFGTISGGLEIREVSFEDYNATVKIRDIRIDWLDGSGTEQIYETEGITVQDGILYFGNPAWIIKAFWAENVLGQ